MNSNKERIKNIKPYRPFVNCSCKRGFIDKNKGMCDLCFKEQNKQQ